MDCPRARTKGLVVEALDDGATAVVIDRRAGRAHALGAASLLVFRLCDGERSIAELATELHAVLGVPRDEAIVRAALAGLSRAGLLEAPLSRAASAVSAVSASRRATVKHLAATGMIALTTLAYVPRAAGAHRQEPRAAIPTHATKTKAQAKLPSGPFGGPSVDKPFPCIT